MEAASSPVGVAAAAPVPLPEWPQEPRWVSSPGDLSVRLPAEPAPAWSRSAQGAAALFLLLALFLLGWHAWSVQRWNCRPAILEADALFSPSIDLNQADRAQLLQLPHVGESLARRIEAYRSEHHGFHEVDELRRVNGIGPKTMEKLRPFVYVEAPVRDVEEEPATEPVRPIPAKAAEKKKPLAVGKKKVALTERIDVNHASAAELQRLPGIGPTLSQRLIERRAEKSFQSVEDLCRVRGIGPKTLERLRPHVVIVP